MGNAVFVLIELERPRGFPAVLQNGNVKGPALAFIVREVTALARFRDDVVLVL